MSKESGSGSRPEDQIEIDLRNPYIAAVWAWLVPGAGHLYQRRHAKGILFMVCILGTYFFGLTLGSGHCVYASWRKSDRRWQYICQLGVGAAALPALVQARHVKKYGEPWLVDIMAPPIEVEPDPDSPDDLSDLYLRHHVYFDLGTLFTMIAGLLNVLAIYDAYAGPVIIVPKEDAEPPPPDE